MECILVKIRTENSYITVANVYISPNQTIDIDKLSTIFIPKTIIVGDLNAKINICGSPANDHRGLLIKDLLDKKNFVILNNGQPTYTHQTGYRSHLDLSIVHQSLATNSVWEVMDDTLGSDHCPTLY